VGQKYHVHEAAKGVTKVAMVRKQVAKHYDTPKLPGYGNFSIFYFFFYESWHGPEANSQSLAL
jgi:hypothetical protein